MRSHMRPCANGEKSGVVEWVEKNILSLFGHTERMKRKSLSNMCNQVRLRV